MSGKKLIAIPTDRGESENRQRSAHFGHSDQFTIIEVDGQDVTIANTVDNVVHGAGGCLAPISLLKEQQIDGIIVGGMGKRPLAGFTGEGINVYWAPLENYPKLDDVITALLENKLQKMSPQEACTGHGCHHD